MKRAHEGSGKKQAAAGKSKKENPQQNTQQLYHLYHTLVESCNDGIVIIQDRVIKFANTKLLNVCGYSESEAIDRSLMDFVAPASRETVSERYRRRMAGEGVPSRYEIALLNKSGHEIRVDLNVSLIDYYGKPAEMAIVCDITEQKTAEEALRKSAEKYRLLADNVSDVVWVLDIKTLMFTYFSPSVEKMRGYTPEQAMALPLEKTLTPASYQSALANLKDSMQIEEQPGADPSRSRILELEEYCRDGSIVNTEARVRLLRDKAGLPSAILGITRDITERRRVQEQLGQSQRMLSTLIDNLQGMAYRCKNDADWTVEFISKNCVDITGYEADELVNNRLISYNQLIIAEDRQSVCDNVQDAVAKKLPFTMEYRITTREGMQKWVSEKGRGVFSSSAEVEALEGFITDITERKRMEQALYDEAKRRRILVDQSRDGIVVLDQNGAVYEANQRFCQMLGYSLEETMHLHVWDWEFLYSKEQVMGMVRDVGVAGDFFETRHRRKDGSCYDVEISTNAAVIGGQKLILCVCRDITERKQAEQLFAAMLDNAAIGIYITQDGKFKLVNPYFLAIAGYQSVDEVREKDTRQFVYSEDRELVRENAIARLKSHRSDPYEYRYLTKNGELRWATESVAAIVFDGRRAVMGSFIDVTDRKRSEEEQSRMQKLESVGILAGGIAHDFNNILTAILGNISLARMEIPPGNEVGNALQEAEKASMRAKDLTQQLLTFARGGAPVRKLTSVEELIRETAAFTLRGSNVQCQFSLPAELWQVNIDTGQISQVISNLVINARQSMPMGGSIQIAAENITLTKEQSLGKSLPLEQGDYLRITVIDHGTGISSAHLDRIFDPYFTTKQTGSGLGLATSYSIVRNHGGYISVESKVDDGSKFYVYLPASREKARPVDSRKDAIEVSVKGKVLVMDDEQVVREVAGRMLQKIGFAQVEYAADGAEAIARYQAARDAGHGFALVVLDLTVPGGMGGREVMKRLTEIDPAVKAIVSSGYADESIIAEYAKYGFKGIVPKPYTLEQMREAVVKVLAS
jgi:two-component system cell cycle sensor histidine kinase/response regulator CckA